MGSRGTGTAYEKELRSVCLFFLAWGTFFFVGSGQVFHLKALLTLKLVHGLY